MPKGKVSGKNSLDKMIDDRASFLEEVTSFAESITSDLCLDRICKVSTVAKLLNFDGFSFYVSLGQHETGGGMRENLVAVWYGSKSKPVLDIRWVGGYINGDSAEVRVFDKNREWQKKILETIENQENVNYHPPTKKEAKQFEEKKETWLTRSIKEKARRLKIKI